jgi:hypothetical protein
VHALSNNRNWTALAFQTAELSIIEYDIFKFFHTPGNGNEDGEIFFILFIVPDYNRWMEYIMRQPEDLN